MASHRSPSHTEVLQTSPRTIATLTTVLSSLHIGNVVSSFKVGKLARRSSTERPPERPQVYWVQLGTETQVRFHHFAGKFSQKAGGYALLICP